MAGKFYVVWVGVNPGIYRSWEECKLQIEGFPNAKYKSFDSQEDAVMAYRGNPMEHIGILKEIVKNRNQVHSDNLNPEIRRDAWAVDGACSKNPGPVEYRCVRVADGRELFRVGPLEGGTNNIGEYLALVHALALLDKTGDTTTPVYADSITSLAWLRNKGHRSKIQPDGRNSRIIELLNRADNWVQTHPMIPNPVIKWNTEKWGEIPADFGRK